MKKTSKIWVSSTLLFHPLAKVFIIWVVFELYLGQSKSFLSYNCFRGNQILGQFREIEPRTQNQVKGHTKRDPKPTVTYLTWNEALLLCEGHLIVQLYLFYWYWGIRGILGSWPQIPLAKSSLRTKEKYSKVFGSTFHINWGIRLVPRPSESGVISVSQYLGIGKWTWIC